MSDNIIGSHNQTVKLYNNTTLDLSRLNNLFGQSTSGSVFSKFDESVNGGNSNHIFDFKEIKKIKAKIIELAGQDGVLSKAELSKLLGINIEDTPDDKNKMTREKVVSELTHLLKPKGGIVDFSDIAPNEDIDITKGYHVYDKYTVQPGDTPKVIAKKLGLKGDKAKLYAKQLEARLIDTKQLNSSGWLMVGQKIDLPKEDAAKLMQSGDYSEDQEVLNKKWANTEYGKKIIAETNEQKAQVEDTDASTTSEPELSEQDKDIDKDLTPQTQRLQSSSVRQNAQNSAAILKDQIESWSINSHTKEKLSKEIKNTNVAYILEAYPDIASKIDDEYGMDVKDVQKFVVAPLNARLKELGLNKKLIPDVSKMDIKDVQKYCNDAAQLIRQVDDENGYVYNVPENEKGQLHKPRLATQMQYYDSPEENQKGVETPFANAVVEHLEKSKFTPVGFSKIKSKEATSIPKEAPSVTSEQKSQTKEKTDDSKYLLMQEMSYPEKMRTKIADLRRSGYEANVAKTRNGFKIQIGDRRATIERLSNAVVDDLKVGSGSDFYAPSSKKLQKGDSLLFDESGSLIQESKKYANGVAVTKFDSEGKAISQKLVKNQTVEYDKVDSQREIANSTEPIAIHIKRPEHLNDIGTMNANIYADSLESNKPKLMKQLNLTNEQYDTLANIAMGIAEQETHFGSMVYEDTKGEKHFQGRYLKKAIAGTVGLVNSAGVTQIRWGLNFEGDEYPNKTLRAQAEKFGITGEDDFKNNPANAAILTMILLNNKRITAEGETWQNRLTENNAKVENPKDRMTTEDVIALSWNGMGKIVPRFKNPDDVVTIHDRNSAEGVKDGTSYARLVRAYKEKYYNVVQDELSRNKSASLDVQAQSNNGKIGSVIFMPQAYTNDVSNTQEELKILHEALDNNSTIPEENKNALLMAVLNKEISFGYGLTKEEAESISASDVNLMLGQLDALKGKISNVVNPAKIREAAQEAQDEFKSKYLESRQVVVNDSDVDSSSILRVMRSKDIVNERLVAKRDTHVTAAHINTHAGGARRAIARTENAVNAGYYRGFQVQRDLGVNPYDSNGDYIPEKHRELAEYASDVSADLGTSGQCFTGVKLSLEASGNAKKGDFVYPKGHKDYGKVISVPKDSPLYFDSEPEKYEEIKYVSLGNGTSREINSTDVNRLPAGYIAVFIPGEGFEDEPGHIVITNGNGQGYADEVDNLKWADYINGGSGDGKGEHGTYRIYRLKV